MNYEINQDALLERFLSYVKIDTTSKDEVDHLPSTEIQFDLAKILKAELDALNLSDVRLDEQCYVYARLPENLPDSHARKGKVPAIGFIAHMDTSNAVSGTNVSPVIHKNYKGSSITLPADTNVVLSPVTDPALNDCEGMDIITSDGTTLLGADDKAGIAAIMSMLSWLKEHPEVTHGPVHIAFTPDEEVGRGVDGFDVEGFGAEVAYTIDGEYAGEVEDETFCADSAVITFSGIGVHPGYAKGKMVSALKMAAAFIAKLPPDGVSPETTEGREGFVHPHDIRGNEETTTVKFLLRDFDVSNLDRQMHLLEGLATEVKAHYPNGDIKIERKAWYRNMKEMLDLRPEVTELAKEAVVRAGLEPISKPIRGGTDGARLSFMGLPTPNIFTGGHNFHSRREWIALQHMAKASETCLHIIDLWLEKGEKKGLLPKA